MQDADDKPGVIRFGVFEADLQAGELRKNARKVRLQDQPFRVLAYLLQHPGQVVTREELRQHLWGDEVFVDFDHSLNMAVKKIRDVLGDSATTPRYVETLPKRGYRFITPVQGLPQLDKERERPVERTNRTGRYVAAAVLAVVIAAGVWLTARRPETPAAPLKELPLTTYRGHEHSPALSPDGNRVAFCADIDGDGNQDIYVKQIDSPESLLKLTDHPAPEKTPTWSPDGSRIAYLREASPWAVFEQPAVGGPERKLVDVIAPKAFWMGRWRIMSWSPDGRFLALASRQGGPHGPSRIFLLTHETGELRPLTELPSGSDVYHYGEPAFSPDGTTLAFTRWERGVSESRIHLLGIKGDGAPDGEPRRLSDDGLPTRGLDWAPDGRSLIFSAGTASIFRLYRLPIAGGEPELLEVGHRSGWAPAISRRGNRLVFVSMRDVRDIWRSPGPLASDSLRGTPPERLISSTWADDTPEYSPDGNKIVFGSDRTGSEEIWVCDSDGSGAMALTSFGSASVHPSWSPDGKWIAFASNKDGVSQIYAISAAGGSPRRVTQDTVAAYIPAWSRDGRWIYFLSNRGEGFQTFKIPAGGGELQSATQTHSTLARESWDRKTLYFSGDAERTPGFWRASLETGDEVQMFKRFTRLGWDILEEGIVMVNPDSDPPALDFYSFATERFETFAELPEGAGRDLSVSPDGQWVIYEREEILDTDLMLVENFR